MTGEAQEKSPAEAGLDKEISDSIDELIEKPKKKAKKKEKPPEDFSLLDLRVGRIIRVEENPYSRIKSFLQNVEVGEDVTMLAVSDLHKHYDEESLLRRKVVVACNVITKKKRGLRSEVWLLVGNTGDKVELLTPPEECEEGDQITVEGYPGIPDLREEAEPRTCVMNRIFKDLRINSDRVAEYRGIPLRVNGKGELTTETLTDCPITDAIK